MDISTLLIALIVLVVAIVIGLPVLNAYKTSKIAEYAETMVPPSGKFVTANGRRFHVVEKGEGPAIVFIHGLGGNLHNFDIPLWPHMGEGYRMIAIDRRGSGYSQQDWGNDGLPLTHADDIAAILDQLGVERALFAGHSLGGAISLAAAITQPHKVAGLALISPLTAFSPDVPPVFKALYIPNARLRKFIAHTFAIPAAIKAQKETLDIVFGPQPPPDDFAIAGAAMTGARPSHFYATSTDLVCVRQQMEAIEARYGEIKVPAGILFGTADRVLDYHEHGEGARGRIPGVQLDLIEGQGHMPQYGEPQKVAAFIRSMAQKAFAA